tara:strand:+ start:4707 stop:4832 length:126 start_codon:yes stop_codon:yes gene_type:complete
MKSFNGKDYSLKTRAQVLKQNIKKRKKFKVKKKKKNDSAIR